jgi:hypothetical protein
MRVFFGHGRPKKGWRRSLPDLIYSIQIDLVGYRRSALSARPTASFRATATTALFLARLPPRGASIAIGLAKALGQLHQQRILHKDIKPPLMIERQCGRSRCKVLCHLALKQLISVSHNGVRPAVFVLAIE